MKHKKHVPLIVAPYSKSIVGGISSWTNNLMVYNERMGHKDIYQVHCYANHLKAVTNTNAFVRIITGIILYSKLLLEVLSLILKFRPSLMHITSSASMGLLKDVIFIWMGKLTNTPVVFHWRFGRIPDLAKQNNWEWRQLKYVAQKCNISIVIDKKSHDTFLEQGFSNVINIPNPLPLDIEQKAINQLACFSARFTGRVLFVGYVIRNKGIFELVEACIGIHEIDELIIIGPYEEDVKNELIILAQQRENGNWLKLLGQQNKGQVLEYMGTSQILALPSYTEGFPNVVIEAMAMGCAIVATDVGAIPEMIDSGSEKPCGICVPPRNVEKLKEAIIDLVVNIEKAKEMGRNGIEKVMNNYTLEKIIEQYVRVWDNVTQKKK